jgi:diguanylate cyclase (GGDEF)-like protein
MAKAHDATARIHTVVVGHPEDETAPDADDVIRVPVTDDEVRSRLSAGLRYARRIQQLEDTTRRLQLQARTDVLTGIANRREIEERLEAEFARAARSTEPLSLLMIDIDHFKNVNDTWGHAAGDDVLRAIAASLATWLRRYDVAGRWGGEEFMIVLPECSRDHLPVIANRLRVGIAGEPVMVSTEDGDVPIPVTLSIGGATLDDQQIYGSVRELIAAADAAVYRSKRDGRNRVTVFKRVPPAN